MESASTSTTSTTSTSGQTLYLGLGVGIGGLLLVAIIAVCIQIARKIRQHKRDVQLLEQGQLDVPAVQQRPSHEIRNSIILGRRNSLLAAKPGWDALSSTDSLDQHGTAKGKMPLVHLGKKNKKRGIHLKALKHLSAITESPRSRNGQSPALATIRQVHEPDVSETQQQADFMQNAGKPVGYAETADFPIRPEDGILDKHINALGLKLLEQPIRLEVDKDRPKPPRSVSVGDLIGSQSSYSATGRPASMLAQLCTHVRSVSLGGQPPQQLPPDPKPDFPVISPHNPSQEGLVRPASQSSVSSEESASSSVLLNSPCANRAFRRAPTTPLAQRSISNSNVVSKGLHGTKLIIQSHVVQTAASCPDLPQVSPITDTASELKRALEDSSSVSSFEDDSYKLSYRRTIDGSRPSKSRISPALSGQRSTSSRKTSVKRTSRSGVSAAGSPSERKRPGILRDISGNSLLPTRQLSDATQDSTNSSDGNPFQWDNMSAQKPSALKGSPNARKGHKRQNCVRISTLTPQVLGPPPARSNSPNIAHRIAEEESDGESPINVRGETRFTSNRRPSRPLSGVGAVSSLRVQTLRASLTPSSPTLSLWATYQDPNLPSQVSDQQLTGSMSNLSRTGSNISSTFSIPTFPSPSKVTTSEVQMDTPKPEFYTSRPLTDSPEMMSSPFDLHATSGTVLSSSPPVVLPLPAEYDPAWPPMPKFDVGTFTRYDPASPLAPRGLFERTPPLADSTVTLSDFTSSEERKGTAGDDGHERLQTTRSYADELYTRAITPRSDKLTSSNASSVMAQMPFSVFPGAPVLSPPHDDYPIPAPLWLKRSTPPHNDMMVPTLSVSSPTDDISLTTSNRLNGPRNEPPKSVLKNAMALRRMNSEIDTSHSRESRRYVQMGREGSPMLPLYGSPNLSESCNDLFDFGFDTQRDLDAGAGAIESLGIVSGTRFCRETSSFYTDLPTIREVQQYIAEEDSARRGGKKRRAIAMDKENYWSSSPPPDETVFTADNAAITSPKQHTLTGTPKSLYDAAGFLRDDTRSNGI